ncbi:aldo/keto reductase [Chromatiales bacterium (ex Bugula neritina AB1)]|nr:aldo/keto reductase [Chromatiales bacterium (ex Bugula neritina AB1)]
MKYRKLADSELNVSAICLGTMTWGTQNTQAEAHAQMDLATERGVNLFDTAEMYPTTPMGEETQGHTEAIIGSWVKKSNNRERVNIATKVTGPGVQKYIQGGVAISPKKIAQSLEGSLRRLQTETIDLYQLHWPNRGSYHFRQWSSYDPTAQPREETLDDIREILFALQKHIEAGKIRHIGLSNESCWGTAKFLQIAKENRLPKVVSIQNEYNLLNRLYDLDLAELSHHENIGLLAFSPMAAGLLSGKYADGKIPAGSRRTLNDTLGGRLSAYSQPALDQYLAIAKKHNIDPAQLALAFCISRPFMASTIIGATTMEQLETNLGSVDITLSKEILDDISAVRRTHPIPM